MRLNYGLPIRLSTIWFNNLANVHFGWKYDAAVLIRRGSAKCQFGGGNYLLPTARHLFTGLCCFPERYASSRLIPLHAAKARCISAEQRDCLTRLNGRAEFAMQVSDAHCMNLLGVEHLPINAGPVSRGAGVVRKIGVVAEIACCSNGSLDAHIREIAGDDEAAYGAAPEIEFEVGPSKPTVYILDHDDLARLGL